RLRYSMLIRRGGRSSKGPWERLAQRVAARKSQDRHARAGMGEKMTAILVQRSREPPAARALVVLEPMHAFGQPRVLGRDIAASRQIDRQASRITVARFHVL